MSKKFIKETSTIYQDRPVDTHTFPLKKGVRILHPERALLLFKTSSADLGALCYLRRSYTVRLNNNHGTYSGRKVDLNSFSTQRAEQIRKCITNLSEDLTNSGKSISTILGKALIMIRFMDWADDNNHSSVLNSASTSRAALSDYNNFLRERVNQNQIKLNTAGSEIAMVCDWLNQFMDCDDLHRGINLIRSNFLDYEPTMPPSEEVQSKTISLCKALFNGFTELVLDKKPYPFRIQMPKYLGWEDNSLWVFPGSRWCLPPFMKASRQELLHGCWAYNYSQGRVNTLEEIYEQVPLGRPRSFPCRYRYAISAAKRLISDANADPRSYCRVEAGMRAHHMFVLLFVANTGLNWTQIINLRWDDKFRPEISGRQGFRVLKWRAGGRMISIEIQRIFVDVFERFLELRSYILNGKVYDHLFFSLGSRRGGTDPKPIATTLFRSLWRTLHIIDPNLPRVMTKQWRAAMSDWYLRKKDPATTEIALQNSGSTVRRSYATGSPAVAADELTTFFEQVKEAVNKGIVLDKGEPIPSGKENAVGACTDFGVPHQLTDRVPILPDCKSQEGCFFCDKYRVHADERDTRKLFSCRYCIQQTAHLPGQEAFFRPVLERIQAIIDEIAKREGNSVMVDKIRREVEEDGELDPYWASKLELLINLELITV